MARIHEAEQKMSWVKGQNKPFNFADLVVAQVEVGHVPDAGERKALEAGDRIVLDRDDFQITQTLKEMMVSLLIRFF